MVNLQNIHQQKRRCNKTAHPGAKPTVHSTVLLSTSDHWTCWRVQSLNIQHQTINLITSQYQSIHFDEIFKTCNKCVRHSEIDEALG